MSVFSLETGRRHKLLTGAVTFKDGDRLTVRTNQEYSAVATDSFEEVDGVILRLFIGVEGVPGVDSIWLSDGPGEEDVELLVTGAEVGG